ncbi:MAG: RHS repeat-associated core domain-containing protein [Betaproteobacteria bacterium]|nr:RHS repeat-associated core domain-containing protein [Betaproteobacteria bacterium]
MIGEYGAAGVVQETVWLADTPVAVVRPNGAGFEIFYIWSDHLDSPRLVSDTANQVRWEWAQGEPFGGNAANENPGGLGSFAFNLRFPGQYFDQETGLHYNYFRDYDPAIGRYVQSDPIGLKGGINSYGYAWARPLAAMDLYGLSPADVQGVFGDVGNSFPDLRPGRDQIGFEPMQPGDTGGTKPWNGQIVVDQSWANKPCFTRDEYEELFFTLFHEGMHSSDSILRRFLTPNSSDDEHHGSIFRREYFERYRPNNTPQKMWGTPRDTPVDIDRLYRKYRERTPACCRGS